MNLKKKKKGFTLIELMAVIAIIAILAAVLVPTVTGYINRSKKTAIITECRTVMNAIETYNTVTSTTNRIDTTAATEISAATTGTGALVPLVTEGLIDTTKITHIQKATIAEVKEINDNTDKDIINRIVLDGDNFKSLTAKPAAGNP
ncbi:prepilin-type N-terminal cleavage/methylation domain-containing protein [Clostridium gallinarum]|nr:prepilin-type N-terminal cleavage/methylation domain-containing protein [Clostridium gallinarum]